MIIALNENEKKLFDVLTAAGISEEVVALHLMQVGGLEIEVLNPEDFEEDLESLDPEGLEGLDLEEAEELQEEEIDESEKVVEDD